MSSASDASTEGPLVRFFNSLPGRHRPDRTVGWSTVVHFHFKDAQQGVWTVVIENGEVYVSAEHSGTPKCVVTTTEDVFLGIVSGEDSPEMAFFTGKVKVSNPPVMLRFLKSFHRSREA